MTARSVRPARRPRGLMPFQRFLDAHREEVLRVLTALVGPERADDCFQETFLSALHAYDRLAPDSDTRAWVLTIARRKALDEWRAQARAPASLPELDAGTTAAPLGRDENGLWQAVGELPTKQRAAVLLRFAGDLPYAEVAAIVGCSPEAARRNVHEGIRRLRTRWTPTSD